MLTLGKSSDYTINYPLRHTLRDTLRSTIRYALCDTIKKEKKNNEGRAKVKIEKLTKKQEVFLKKWKERYLQIGTDTKRTNYEKAESCIKFFYKKTANNNEPKFIWCDSPLSAVTLINVFKNNSQKINGALEELVKKKKLCELTKSSKTTIEKEIFRLAKDKKINYVGTSLWGQQDAYWVAYYLFGKIIGVNYDKEKYQQLLKYNALIKSCFWIYSFENICFCVRKPKTLKLNNQLRKHCEDGPAIEFHDGFSIYALNDIVVPKWVVQTPAEEIDVALVLKEKNVDVQRELIRKVGYGRIMEACNAETIEKWTHKPKKQHLLISWYEKIFKKQSPYRLQLDYVMKRMKFGNINRRYLCYEHASIPGVHYIKYVPEECKNIIQMRGYQCNVITREQLSSGKYTDDEILDCLPETVQ